MNKICQAQKHLQGQRVTTETLHSQHLAQSFQMLCVILMLKHEVKEIPNWPISIHLYAHQGQLIMAAGTKTTIRSEPTGKACTPTPMHSAP